MTNLKKHIASAALALLVSQGVAQAGRGGSASRIKNAVATGSVDAIIAEVERAEHLVCQDCRDPMMALLEHDRYEIREVAGWWFAKRPSLKKMLIPGMQADLASASDLDVRNAADFLGTVRDLGSVDALTAVLQGGTAAADARLHVIRGLGRIGATTANPGITLGMSDADARVRREALIAWAAVLGQSDAGNAINLATDGNSQVRARACAVVGQFRDGRARAALEQVVLSDADPAVRRNAAWALGRIGERASRPVLETASQDPSGLVRRTARAAITLLR
jgi:hypothetical protein